MALLDAIRASLNPAGMQGLPMQLTPSAGMAKNIGGLLDVVMQNQPQYMQNAMNKAQLQGAMLQNQNAPISNALKNALMQQQVNKLGITNQLLPETLQSQNALRQMQAQAMPQRLALQAGRLDLDRQRFSPEQLQALLDWRRASTETAPLRALTATGKGIMEQANIDSGLMPTGQDSAQAPNALVNAISGGAPIKRAQSNLPDSPESLSGQYALLRQKQVTDADTRKRNLFATNIDKTSATIDPNIVAYYSGPEGKARLARDSSLGIGKASPQYKEYMSIVQRKIPLLAGQIRQFYGESIQPTMREHLEKLIDPRTWQDPDIGLQGYNDMMSLLGNEMQTYRDALKNTAVYQGSSQGSAKPKQKYSEEDIEHTAKTHNMTVEEVKRRLGVS